MSKLLIRNARLVNEGQIIETDVLVENGFIAQIKSGLSDATADRVIDAAGRYLLPGVIDDQVHFREPGLTHKATIGSEARAAVVGGVTSFMEMPNTVPNALTQELLADKYAIAAQTSLANYSFFMGASNTNLDEVLRTDPQTVCGIKVFMGSSTGNMLVDNEQILEALFRQSPMLIATHCEDEATVRANTERYRAEYGDRATAELHPLIRNEEACLKSSSMAVDLARRHNARLHILHISTADELVLFDNTIPLTEKRITSEVCVHHLWFDSRDYARLGNLIKCNPAIKAPHHKEALLAALLDDRLDIIATDHAPHTWDEKQQSYWQAPSGLPLVQHPLLLMLDFVQQGKLSIETVVRKMSHAPADCFQIDRRGYVREGYWADLVLVDMSQPTTVSKSGLYYQCGWSPLEGHTFGASVTDTIVSGELVYQNGALCSDKPGQRLAFAR
ncbi:MULTISPECIES: dihydroorotase [unclassified Spirosoma]|uniref:dihydroorotase n=1 Tax=unclassified Spirosoma TaxID=2621999 RepID=UPI00095DFBA6|nr:MULTISPECIES: dihydroorotase [unclassified Spirosoma]MBN8822942.1 dihydroorotase [Spirosoma sp.]OJW80126.1 MAG: dihydroorotase [Spirosoma sp. 48-14]